MSANIIFQPLLNTLKEARHKKKLSQKGLATKLDIPQSHLSKIETGQVNLTLSLFIEWARSLELEVILVPREQISIVKHLIQENPNEDNNPMYSLNNDKED